MNNVVSFFILQLINTIFSTIKSIITVKSKPLFAGVINAFYFAFYYYVIKLITNEELVIVVVVSFITNLIGVIIGKKIIEYFEKEKL